MPLPLLAGLGHIVVGFIASNARVLFKFVLLGAFLSSLISFGVWFLSFAGDIYILITGSISNLTTNYSGLLGCILDKLGMVEFMNSAFSIFFTAAVIWGTSVGTILTFRLGFKAYDFIFKSLS